VTAPANAAPVALTGGELWQAILDAGESARRNSGEWDDYSPYLPESVWAAIGARVSADGRAARRAKLRVRLATNHYLQVAFAQMPTLPDGSIDMQAVHAEGLAWLAAHRTMPRRNSTGSAVRTELRDELVYLSDQLKHTRPRIEIWVILTIYAERLLAALPPSESLLTSSRA
jgi:hypothetical protein